MSITEKFRPPKAKICTGCKKEKLLKDFYLNSESPDGRHSKCGDCLRAVEDQKKTQRKEKAKKFFDAKYFMLAVLLSTSLTAFSQVDTLKLGNRKVTPTDSVPENIKRWIDTVRFAPLPEPYMTLEVKPSIFWTGEVVAPESKPDTLRAYILVTMCRKCAAEAIPGYVVIEQGKRPVYLDCRKRALKGKQVGWGWREVNQNKQ